MSASRELTANDSALGAEQPADHMRRLLVEHYAPPAILVDAQRTILAATGVLQPYLATGVASDSLPGDSVLDVLLPELREAVERAVGAISSGEVYSVQCPLTVAAGQQVKVTARHLVAPASLANDSEPLPAASERQTLLTFESCSAPELEPFPPTAEGREESREVRSLSGRQVLEQMELSLAGSRSGSWVYRDNPEAPQTPDELLLSDEQKALIGFGPEEFPCSATAWRDRILPEDLAAVQPVLEECRQGRRSSYSIQYRIRHRNGSYVWLESRGTATFDAQRRPILWAGLSWDITEQKQSERHFARLAAVVSSCPDAIVTIDRQGIITTWNHAAEQLYGYTAVEAVGKPIAIIDPSPDGSDIRSLRQRIMGGEHLTGVERKRRRQDGRLVHVMLSFAPIVDQHDGLLGIASVARDISNLKRVQQKLETRVLHQEAVARFGQRALELDDADELMGEAVAVISNTLDATCLELWWAAEEQGLSLRGSSGWHEPLPLTLDPEDQQELLALTRRITHQGRVVRWQREQHVPPIKHWQRHELECTALDKIVVAGGKILGILAVHRAGEPGFDEEDLDFLRSMSNILGQAAQRIEASLATRLGEQRYRSLIKVMTAVIWRTNPAGECIEPQPSWEAYTGMSWEQYRGRGWLNALHPADRNKIRFDFPPGTDPDGRFAVEGRVWHGGSGEYRYFQAMAVPLLDATGQVREWVGCITDVDSQRRDQEALRLSEERLSMAQKAGNVGTFDRDFSTGRVVWTETLARMFGFKPGEFDGLNETAMKRIHPEDLPRIENSILAAISKQQSWDNEFRVIWPDGSIRWISGRADFVFNESGEPQRMVGVSVDITRRRQAERELKDLNETLEQRVTERTALLRLLYEVTSEATAADSLSEAADLVITRVCDIMGCSWGQAFIFDDNDPTLLIPVKTNIPPTLLDTGAVRTLRLPLPCRHNLPARVVQSGRPHWLTPPWLPGTLREGELPTEAGIHSAMAFPILAVDEVVGVIELYSDQHRELTTGAMETFATLGAQLGRVFERKRFERQLADAVWAEQQRVGRELHDGVGQQLTGLAMMIRSLGRRLESQGTEITAVSTLEDLVAQIQKSVREVLSGLQTVEIERASLLPALALLAETAADRYQINCQFTNDGEPALQSDTAATHLYHIAKEVVHNAAKHSLCTEVSMRLEATEDQLRLQIADNGTGFDVQQRGTAGLGMRIMRQRASLIGAVLTVTSRIGEGTSVECTWER